MQGFTSFLGLLYLAMLVLAVVALVMAAIFRDDAYRAADKQNKGFSLIILGIAVAVNLLVPMLFLQLAGLVAGADAQDRADVLPVRPALLRRQLRLVVLHLDDVGLRRRIGRHADEDTRQGAGGG